MKVTIKEIAELAGVHRATVDKVLHGRAGVSDEVRARVQGLIDQLGYTPNPAGRVLQKQGRTYRIAAILVDVDALPFLREGISQGVAAQTGFHIDVSYFITKFQQAQQQKDYIDQAVAEQADGIIISPINSPLVRDAINRAADAGVVVVTANSDIDGTRRTCYVGLDSLHASRIAGRLMGQLLGGQGKIAVISSATGSENNNYYVSVREQGFCEFLRRHYPDVQIAEYIEGFEDPETTYSGTAAALQKHPDLRGIYVTCGGAAEVGRALRQSGRADAVKVLSYEDYPQIISLIQDEVFDCTLSSELLRQGSLPVAIIMDYLVFGRRPSKEQLFTEVRILVKESFA